LECILVFTLKRVVLLLLAVTLGLINTVLLLGPGPINPTNIDWIFGDTATYYFAWGMYRYDPHLHLPLGWTERVGYPAGASIAWLDAIPLVALVLRPLSPLLPEPFQYLGLYAAACFVLQAYFGLRLSRRLFPSQPVFIVLGSVFFLLSAPLTWRAQGHIALLSHWLILAALDRYFRATESGPLRYFVPLWIVLALAAAINPYVAAMCLLVALAGVGRLLMEGRCPWTRAALLSAATMGVIGGTMVLVGVLAAGEANAYWALGYGQMSFNLNALANPMQYGSLLLPALPLSYATQYEGYNYLGAGLLALLAVGLAARPRAVAWLADRRLLPLLMLAIVSTLLATSTTVTFGSRTVLEIALPAWAVGPLHGLRASGRLFWPAYYLIVLAALSLTFNVWRAPYRTVILAIALGIQTADLLPLRTRIRSTVDHRFASSLRAPVWRELGEKSDNLMLLPPFQCSPIAAAGGSYNYVDFGKLATAERMRSNNYYAARYSRADLQTHCVDLLRTQLAGTLDANSTYVVTDGVRTAWSLAGMRSHSCSQVDGYNLCTPVRPDESVIPLEVPNAAPYALGDRIDFSWTGNSSSYVTVGWGVPSSGGTWTEGPVALLRLGVDGADDPSRAFILEASVTAFIERAHRRLDVDVVVNGQTVDHWVVRSAGRSRRQTRIPGAVAAARRGLDIEFRMRNPAAPLIVGSGASTSFLGLNVREVVIRYE
jgi:Family of unknown function (DUF6311)